MDSIEIEHARMWDDTSCECYALKLKQHGEVAGGAMRAKGPGLWDFVPAHERFDLEEDRIECVGANIDEAVADLRRKLLANGNGHGNGSGPGVLDEPPFPDTTTPGAFRDSALDP